MRPYIITTGTIFGLITLAHFWRMFAENRRLATDPIFILLTLLSASLSLWAVRLLRQHAR
jgi:hypothetical protein